MDSGGAFVHFHGQCAFKQVDFPRTQNPLVGPGVSLLLNYTLTYPPIYCGRPAPFAPTLYAGSCATLCTHGLYGYSSREKERERESLGPTTTNDPKPLALALVPLRQSSAGLDLVVMGKFE